MSDWDGQMETRVVGPPILNAPTMGQMIRQRKLEEGKCEAMGCQQFVEGGGFCESCESRQLRQQSKTK